MHRQAAHGDRDRRVDEEDVADGVAQRLLDDVGQAQQRDVLVVDVVDRHQREEDHQPADDDAVASALMIAGGALRRGSLVSSASVPAVSNPYMTYALMIPPMMKAPK